eukprot:g34222.t1
MRPGRAGVREILKLVKSMFRPLGCRLEAEYEMLLLQFAGDVIVILEEAQDGHITQGVGGAQMLYKAVSKSPLGLTHVQEATSGAADAVDQVDGHAGEPMTDVE